MQVEELRKAACRGHVEEVERQRQEALATAGKEQRRVAGTAMPWQHSTAAVAENTETEVAHRGSNQLVADETHHWLQALAAYAVVEQCSQLVEACWRRTEAGTHRGRWDWLWMETAGRREEEQSELGWTMTRAVAAGCQQEERMTEQETARL